MQPVIAIALQALAPSAVKADKGKKQKDETEEPETPDPSVIISKTPLTPRAVNLDTLYLKM